MVSWMGGNDPLRVLDLFSGIGGFSLGLERTGGFETVAFCEINPFGRKVLRRHWPSVPIFPDVRKLTGEQVGPIDVICGGFPCQPFSQAGARRGAADERYLWPEMLRLIREIKPAWVCGENVVGIVGMELENICASLEGEGYAVQPLIIPASSVGAPHDRKRVWILAHRDNGSDPVRWNREFQEIALDEGLGGNNRRRTPQSIAGEWRENEPRPYGVADGIPDRVDRNNALGATVVPQVVTQIGFAILEAQEKSIS